MVNSKKVMLKSEFLTKLPVVCLLAAFCCMMWGSAFPMIKIGYQAFGIASSDTGSQLLFAGLRFSLAGAMNILLFSILRRKPLIPSSFSSLSRACILSTFQTILQYLFFYIGLSQVSGVKASILTATNVFAALLLSVLLRQEKLTPAKIIGGIIGFLGVVLINAGSGGLDFQMRLSGEGFIVFAALASAVSSVLMKRFSQQHDPVMLSSWQFLFGGIVLSLCGILSGGHLTWSLSGLWIFVYLAFVSAASYTIWSMLLKYNPVSKVAVFGFMNPVCGVFLSTLLVPDDNTSLGWRALASLLLVCAGIIIVNLRARSFPDKM